MECEETGETIEYCGASKHWEWVNPKITNRHSLHFAPEDRVYIILKNKYTKKWEFPTGKFYLDESFTRGMQNVFKEVSGMKFRVSFQQPDILAHTIR